MSNKTINMTEELYEYLLSVSLREPSLLKHLRAETAKYPMANMQIAPEQGQFMALLVQLLRAKKALEIGVFTGYSALCVALALSADGKLIACDVSEEWTKVARRYWQEAGVAHKIELRLAPALETLDKLLDDGQAGTFDFAFIDADKTGYDDYYERSLQLLRPGGLIVLDNMLRNGRVVDAPHCDVQGCTNVAGGRTPGATDEATLAIHKLNQKLHHDSRIALSLLPLADGLTLALKL
ncbi:MAG: class I SAM-dependent methyltransferase [Gammaproteobacteria bacterium]|nr:class I SAM-dependent methyltransferase [Gammaproteobacteria bacterium]